MLFFFLTPSRRSVEPNEAEYLLPDTAYQRLTEVGNEHKHSTFSEMCIVADIAAAALGEAGRVLCSQSVPDE